MQTIKVYEKAGATTRIHSAANVFTAAESAIAELVLAKPASVIQMPIAELAQAANVGQSTIVRFCRVLGYSGYQDFKLHLAQDLVESAPYIRDSISFKDDIDQLAAKIFQSNIQAVENTRQALDPQQIKDSAAGIALARKIEIYGIGYSFFTALDAKYKLLRLGLIADAFGDGHLQVMGASALTKKDVAVGISHSGASRDTVDALSTAKQSGAMTIAVTNFPLSPITAVADRTLVTVAHETPLGGEVLTSRIAQLCVIDVLSAAVALRLGSKCLGVIQKATASVASRRY